MTGKRQPGNRATKTILFSALLLLAVSVLLSRPVTGQSASTREAARFQIGTPAAQATPTSSPTQARLSVTSQPVPAGLPDESGRSAVLLSLLDQDGCDLYLLQSDFTEPQRLTDTSFSIITPALSPDGQKLAFSSNQSGYWDLYVLDLTTKSLINLTNTTEYDASPAWSPDGQYLAYETYIDKNLEIQILKAQADNPEIIRLTIDPAADHSPAWSPDGRYLLFVSNRSGDDEIWRADLQITHNRFVNLSGHPSISDNQPAWSNDGTHIYWTQTQNGLRQIVSHEVSTGRMDTLLFGSRPLPDPLSTALMILNQDAVETVLSIYSTASGKLASLPVLLPGEVKGLTWVPEGSLQTLFQSLPVIDEDGVTTASQDPAENELPRSGTNTLSALEDVNVPQAYLASDVVERYDALRTQIERMIGWNFLDSLENAFVPITQPPSPGMAQSWLYTGRAIALNTSPLYGGWMQVVREDFNGQTYWRIYLKTRFQDGSQGMPMQAMAWDFTTRSSDTTGYEHGGSLAPVPEGYWVDFTAIAQQYGWLRTAALPNWRSYMDGALYNQYIQADHLTWQEAMLELYPPEALTTATRVPTRTITPLPTP